ncbi:2-phosphosulfolactate phosphatase [Paenibacillus sp. FSL W7-1287]|uniref:2-phosphosulfolactate phosphatase n=1 Tax=Paenibacillus sp. FSL W7-1287 TaxID=2954538 RepID=UPI0030FABE64
MRVQVISNASNVHQAQLIGKTAIVIDVMRTASTIIAAIEAGARCVLPVETIMEAKAIAKSSDLLGGERFCKRISGFDLGNSPNEYRNSIVCDKRIILTTTDGTRAIIRSMRAAELFIASLTNADACIDAAMQTERDLVLICAGSQDQFTLEDGFCAGALIAKLQKDYSNSPLSMNDFGYAMLSLYEHTKHQQTTTLRNGFSGKHLQAIGLEADINDCIQINRTTVVPYLHNGVIVSYPVNS